MSRCYLLLPLGQGKDMVSPHCTETASTQSYSRSARETTHPQELSGYLRESSHGGPVLRRSLGIFLKENLMHTFSK